MTKTIAVVDDMDNFARYEGALRELPHRYWRTVSPHKALDMARNRAPDLLLTPLDFIDYYRTQIDGPELISKMHGLNQRMRFILVSDLPKSDVQPVLDELGQKGIYVRHLSFMDAPENLGVLVRSLIG